MMKVLKLWAASPMPIHDDMLRDVAYNMKRTGLRLSQYPSQVAVTSTRLDTDRVSIAKLMVGLD
jgi:hypothetical protein